MFGLLVLVVLFIAFTPGILFRLKGSKMMAAAMHAALFGLAAYLLWGSVEGFVPNPASNPKPTCPTGSTLISGNIFNDSKCRTPTQPTITNAVKNGRVYECPTGKKTRDINDNIICATCPTGATYSSKTEKNSKNRNMTVYTCNVFTPPTCTSGYTFRGTKCIFSNPVETRPLDKNGQEIFVGSTVICGNSREATVTRLVSSTVGTGGARNWGVELRNRSGIAFAKNCRVTNSAGSLTGSRM